MQPRDARHVIWDWNGTLLDDVTACIDAINRMLDARARPPITRARYREVFQFPVQRYYRLLGFDLAAEDWDAMAREFHAHYDGTARLAALRPGTRQVLAALRDRGTPMSVLSASEKRILETRLVEEQIDHFFDHVYALDNLYAESKLHLGHALLEVLSLPPRDVVLVGDTTHDVEVARALECQCVLVAGGHQAEARLADCGCTMLATIEDLCDILPPRP